MASIKTTLGNRKYTQKPVGIEVGQLQKELMTLGTTEISPLELLYAVGQDGRSFKPAIYTEGSALHNEDFLQTEVIGIDIDVKEGKPWTIEDSIEVLRKNELDYIGIYKSFSYSEERQNHRILFELPAPICNDNLFYFTLMLFNELFPADTACFDKARMFFGGKGVIEGTGKALRLDNLYYACINEMSNDENNGSRKIDDFCSRANLDKINGRPDVGIYSLDEYVDKIDMMTTTPLVYYRDRRDDVKNIPLLLFPNFTKDIVITTSKKYKTNKTKKGAKPVNTNYSYGTEIYSLEKLKDECQLYGDITSGYWADHEELKIICWNFHPLKGAMASVINALLPYEREANNLSYKLKVNGFVGQALKEGYHPKNCSSVCLHFNECNIIKQGYTAPYHYITATRINPIIKLNDSDRFNIVPESVTLNGDLPTTTLLTAVTPLVKKPLKAVQEVATMKFKDSMKSLKEGTATDLIVLKAPTGIGKTKMLIDTDWSQFAGKKVAIAFPTHALKDEVAGEFIKLGVNIGIKPDKNKAIVADSALKEKIAALYEAGSQKAIKLYHDYLTAHRQVPEYDTYLKQLATYLEADILLTTHADVLINQSLHFDYLIIDEDILITSCETKNGKRSDIEGTLDYLKKQLGADFMILDDVLDFIADDTRKICMLNKYNDYNVVWSRYQAELEYIMQDKPELSLNCLKILTADYVTKSVNHLGTEYIHYGKRRKLPKTPVMLMSATTFEAVYQITFRYERDVQFFNIDYVSDGGLLEQDLSYSFSRNSLSKNSDRNLNYIKDSLQSRGKNYKDYTVITFKDYKEDFERAGFTIDEQMHFGNTCGFNGLTGRNIIIAGTPHIPSDTIKLYSLLLFDTIVSELDYTTVEMEENKRFDINGIEITFHSFLNPYVRLIQFYLLQSELLQAVGRSRLIRKPNAEVQVFSNFPLEEVDKFYDNNNRITF